MKRLFDLYKTKNQNIALIVKISVLVWASSNPMGQVQNSQVAPRTSNCIGLISNTDIHIVGPSKLCWGTPSGGSPVVDLEGVQVVLLNPL